MTDHLRKSSNTPLQTQRPRSWGSLLYLVSFAAGGAVVILYTPFARLLGFESFEAHHGAYSLDFNIYIAICILGKSLYFYLFRRARSAAELAAVKDALRHGRLK